MKLRKIRRRILLHVAVQYQPQQQWERGISIQSLEWPELR